MQWLNLRVLVLVAVRQVVSAMVGSWGAFGRVL